MTSRLAVYTCVTGNYDPIRAPERVDPGIDYFCFTDAPDAPAPWRRLPIPAMLTNPIDQNRYVKMHPHRIEPLAAAERTMYVDGSIAIVGDIMDLMRSIEGREEEIFAYEHPDRHCIYEEGYACAYHGTAWVWRIDSQLARYRAQGFPERLGLFEANVLVRRRSPSVERLMDRWWEEYRSGIRRDQLSLSYVAWKEGVRIGSLGRSDPRFAHRIFRLEPHRGSSPWVPRLRRPVNRVLLRTLPHPALAPAVC